MSKIWTDKEELVKKKCGLQAVKKGLAEGRSYKRSLETGGTEYLMSIGDGMFRHEVASTAAGGCGGANEMLLVALDNGRWDKDGWELIPKK